MGSQLKVTECKICGGLQYIELKGKRVPCECLLRKVVNGYLKALGPTKGPLLISQKILDEIDSEKDMVISTGSLSQDRLNIVLAYLLLKRGVHRTYQVRNVYELIEIFLGHIEGIKSIFELTSDILILLSGYYEFENKRQEDILLQTLANRRRQGRITWLVLKGTSNRIPNVVDYTKENEYQKLDLTKKEKPSYEL